MRSETLEKIDDLRYAEMEKTGCNAKDALIAVLGRNPFQESSARNGCRITELRGVGKEMRSKLIGMGLVIPCPSQMTFEAKQREIRKKISIIDSQIRELKAKRQEHEDDIVRIRSEFY